MQEDEQDKVQFPPHIEAGDSTHYQHQDKQNEGQLPPHIEAGDLTLYQPLGVSTASEQPSSPFYLFDEPDDAVQDDPFLQTSFQPSVSLPKIQETAPAPEMINKTNKGRRRLMTIGVVGLLVLVVLGFLSISVFAHPMMEPLLAFKGARASNPVQFAAKTEPTPNRSLLLPPHKTKEGDVMPNDLQKWVPQPLIKEWTNAGLVGADGVEAGRTALAFTDREEGIDFRSVGTRAKHGGTLTAALFILSDGGQMRFEAGDVRVVNNTLFDQVQQHKLIQSAVNLVPHIVQVKVQGKQTFVWIDVTFHLFQSQLDAKNHRVEGLEMDSKTKKPRLHHMSILLVRVTPGTQGAMAPMGGIGWLVSVYGRDLKTPPAIAQPV